MEYGKKILIWDGMWNGKFLVWNGRNFAVWIMEKSSSIPFHSIACSACAIVTFVLSLLFGALAFRNTLIDYRPRKYVL